MNYYGNTTTVLVVASIEERKTSFRTQRYALDVEKLSPPGSFYPFYHRNMPILTI